MILFVWDFHGVLNKCNEVALAEQLNFILKKYGFNRKVGVEEALSFSGKHYRQIFLELCPNAPVKQAIEMADFAVSTGIDFAKRVVRPREHALEVLGKIKASGGINVVASNTAPKNLKEYVEIVGLQGCFDALLSVNCSEVEPTVFSIRDHKLKKIKEFIGNKRFEKIKCIGDRETDIELVLLLKAETYLFNATNSKPKTKAHHIISDLREVLP